MAAIQTSQASNPDKMPTIQRALSKNSGRWQRIARLAVLLALLAIALSAIISAVHARSPKVPLLTYHINLATGIAAILFLFAGLVRLIRMISNPERAWFGSRVLAERTRSLAWRYSAAGLPFPLTGVTTAASEAAIAEALNEAVNEAEIGGIRYQKPDQREIHVITDWMRTTRAKSLDERVRIYAADRIKNQQNFYEQRERENRSNANVTQGILLFIEVLGAILAAVNAFALLDLNLVGVAGTVAAGVTAWVQFNQFSALASTYGTMSYRMAGYHERSLSPTTSWAEPDWAEFVNEVEDALSNEHGAWQHVVQRGMAGTP